MGAAVGKSTVDLSGAADTRAAARLAFAKHTIMTMAQRNRSPAIWDADGNYTNRGFLSAVDKVLLMAEEDPSAGASLDSVVALAMSRMVEEFLRVKVWNASHLRFAVDKLSLAAKSESAMSCFASAGNRTSTASTSDRTSTTSAGDRVSTASTGGELTHPMEAYLG
ncbi:hypothetical protein PR202_ga08715 [Eleusine coracana subsp. coracana]|uniref:Uncharacterized protein n=1 Tax=Eleusine coracana subsp. coracana TaxID=191504 RepID=A0AAV5C0Q2_ELECO|nr:hypothetical protein PR202_ga08715 [Eleusine coracana subsp. coracana]